MAEMLSSAFVDQIEMVVADFLRNRGRDTPPPPHPPAGLRAPIRGILLEDLVDGGKADCAVTQYVKTSLIQKITMVGQPQSGSFTLAFKGQTTKPLNYNCTADDMDKALEALSSIGPNNVKVSLGKGSYTNDDNPGAAGRIEFPGVWLVEFTGIFAALDSVPLLVIANSVSGATVIIDETSHWADTGHVETVVATIPVGSPTPMVAGAVVGCIHFPGVGYGFPGVECRDFAPAYHG